MFKFLKPAPHLPEIDDQEVVKQDYKYWRIRILYSIFIGYAFYYFTRKSFTFAMPGIIEDLGYERAQLGILASIWALTYGLSKFVSGLLSDQSNPRYFMAIGLIITGFINIAFGFSSSLLVFIFLWGLNGWFQGFGWPPCTRFLTHWYSHSERGSWWSLCSVSHNVGGFLIPWIVGFCLYYFGWRWAMFIPGVICILGGLFLINRLRDTPQSIGLPPIEKFRDDYPTQDHKLDQETELSTRELISLVITNKYIWLLAIAYFFVHIVRGGVGDWAALYLIQEKGYNKITANGLSSLFEIGGLIGSLSAGWSSDRFFSARRGPVNVLYAMLALLVVIGFWLIPGSHLTDSAAIILLGFAVFGPQLLIGVAAAELVHKKAAASANGFIGMGAYLGIAAAGYPLGKAIDIFGWEGFFIPLIICCFIPILVLIPMWNVTQDYRRPLKKKIDVKSAEEATFA